PIDPRVLRGADPGGAAEQMILIEHPWQDRSRLVKPGAAPVRFVLDAVANGLAKQSVRLLASDQSEQVPRTVRQYHAVNLGGVLNREQQVVESFVGGFARLCRKHPLGGADIFVTNGFAQRFTAGDIIAGTRGDRMQ